ncbi:MAG TPA: hypothetical protein PK883_08055 [Anaerolineaceae bacterium]|jgi:membrane protein YdbS with pleckstrin-like domain|nr:hypothetical protein [Anaerolineaceae bacterium]
MGNQPLLHFEHRKQPLISRRQFLVRVVRHVLFGLVLLLISLGIGVLGYHFLENLSWVDALLNASMILGGMGPVNAIATTGGKIFASLYALFSGIVFLVVAGLMVAPVVHRLFHRMHLDDDQG